MRLLRTTTKTSRDKGYFERRGKNEYQKRGIFLIAAAIDDDKERIRDIEVWETDVNTHHCPLTSASDTEAYRGHNICRA